MFSAFDPPEPNSARFKSFHVIAAEMSQKCGRKNGRDIHGDNNDFLAEKMAEISMAAKTASFTASSVRCESKGFNHQSIG